MNTKSATIYRSDEYSSFNRIGGNRLVNKAHMRRLKSSIAQNPESVRYTPLVVNEKKQIIDGQHRFEALQELKLPVYYIEEPGLTLEDVQRLNSHSKSWTPTDYALSWFELGKESYGFYLELKKKFGYNHDILMRFVSLDMPITNIGFQNGKMKAPNKKATEDLCSKLAEVGQYCEHYKKRSFALAFMSMWKNENYDHSRMITKMQTHAGKELDDLAQVEDNLRVLERIYNKNVRSQDRIRFF
jgi:hypothetical protein